MTKTQALNHPIRIAWVAWGEAHPNEMQHFKREFANRTISRWEPGFQYMIETIAATLHADKTTICQIVAALQNERT